MSNTPRPHHLRARRVGRKTSLALEPKVQPDPEVTLQQVNDAIAALKKVKEGSVIALFEKNGTYYAQRVRTRPGGFVDMVGVVGSGVTALGAHPLEALANLAR